MDIKEYLPFYLGQEVAFNFEEKGILVGLSQSEYEKEKTVAIINVGADNFIEWYTDEVKPILRELSSMTEEEAIKVAEIVLGGQFDSCKFHVERNHDSKGVLRYFTVKRKHYTRYITIDVPNGEIETYDHDSNDIYCHQHEVTRYLLSKGFDIFNLIPNNLAIKK